MKTTGSGIASIFLGLLFPAMLGVGCKEKLGDPRSDSTTKKSSSSFRHIKDTRLPNNKEISIEIGTPIEDVEKQLGKPSNILSAGRGAEMRIYLFRNFLDNNTDSSVVGISIIVRHGVVVEKHDISGRTRGLAEE